MRKVSLHPRHSTVLLAVVIGIVLTVRLGFNLDRERVQAIEGAGARTRNQVGVLEVHARQYLDRIGGAWLPSPARCQRPAARKAAPRCNVGNCSASVRPTACFAAWCWLAPMVA